VEAFTLVPILYSEPKRNTHDMTKAIPALLIVGAILIATIRLSQAGSATWDLNPTSGDWNTAVNWTPDTVPNGALDTATFAVSNQTSIIFESFTDTEVNGIVFQTGASSFTITAVQDDSLTFSGTGVKNNSGVTQNFVTIFGGHVNFTNEATAGTDVIYTNNADNRIGLIYFSGSATAGASTLINNASSSIASTQTIFDDSSSAGSAMIINAAGTAGAPGQTYFQGASTAGNAMIINKGGGNGTLTSFVASSTADTATIINEGSPVAGALGGSTDFVFGVDSLSAGNSTIINYGGAVDGASGGELTINVGATAGNSTLIAYGGATSGAFGGTIGFGSGSNGGTARIKVFGNGTMTLNSSNTALTVGSIEGNGHVDNAGLDLTVGSNNLSTAFRGRIRGIGKLIKIGKGRLELASRNSYQGGTKIMEGELIVNNSDRSGTGTGPVTVVNGTLGGRGIIVGRVNVGDETQMLAILSPGKGSAQPQTLTIQGALTFGSQGHYHCGLDSNTSTVDAVVASGVTIKESIFELNDHGSAALPPGAVFTVIDNTAATPIAGAFSNLPDGGTITVGSNNLQANYEGGDGNDLTLTVVP
jgi:autotransporter-associated beta strand protein